MIFSKQIFIACALFTFALQILGQHHKSQKNESFAGREGAPNYAKLSAWAAHPLKQDYSDSIPPFAKAEIRDTTVDVFFIHPTSYLKNLTTKNWNAELANEKINKDTDEGSIKFQASVFNQHARIYAPRYRQAHIKSFFLRDKPQSVSAIDLAYSDVKTAFEYYIKYENHGRPFIIAAHSQGTLHAIKLIKESIDDDSLEDQMVCAYLVGWLVRKNEFDVLKPCMDANQTQCFVTWRTFKAGEVPKYVVDEQGSAICTNPITWRLGPNETKTQYHLGAVGKSLEDVYPKSVDIVLPKEHGIVWASPQGELQSKLSGVDHYHFIDYNLFYLDIRKNFDQRVKAYLLKK